MCVTIILWGNLYGRGLKDWGSILCGDSDFPVFICINNKHIRRKLAVTSIEYWSQVEQELYPFISVYLYTIFVSQIHFNIIFHYTVTPFKWRLTFSFYDQYLTL